jgi:exodeoxyribonuclease V gamma subunit
LGIYLQEVDAVIDDSEPFSLNNLEKFLIRQDLAAHTLEDKPLTYTHAVMQASGMLPHGTPGEFYYDGLLAANRNFMKKISGHLEGGRQDPVDVDIAMNGFHLTGCLANVYSGGLVTYRPAKIKGRDRLRAWISHLVFNHARTDAVLRGTVLVCEDKAIRYEGVTDTEKRLTELLNLYWTGLRKPLHFFTESSLAFAEAIFKKKEEDKALRAAIGEWDNQKFPEKDNPYYNLCFGQIDPLDDEFRELATIIYEPMLRNSSTSKE